MTTRSLSPSLLPIPFSFSFSFSLLLLFSLLFLLPPSLAQGKAWYDLFDGYQCSSNLTIYPCQGYALYRANAADLAALDLASVGDLFGTSRLLIARASNLSAAAVLRQGQPLLIPLPCSCLSNHSYSPVAYQIQSGDTFYVVSTTKFGNLTTYPAVIAINPTLDVYNLSIGDIVDFPIFCKCLDRATAGRLSGGVRTATGIVTYVLRPSETYSSLASSFGTDVQTLTYLNGPESASNGSFTTILLPLFQDQLPPMLITNSSNTTSNPSPPPAASPPAVITRSKNRGVIIGLGVALAVVGGLWSMQLVFFACFRKGRRGENRDGGEITRTASKMGRSSEEDKLIIDISEWLDKYKVYKIEDLRRATGNFDESSLIKGSVYKGVIDGEVMAVKKMKWDASDELRILQKVNHTNLVKLEGFCIEADAGTCFLVYEYLANGSLDSWLHGRAAGRKLDWRTRLRVALDLANALQYIHEHTWPRVVHKDVKTSNVLLDHTFHAKIANFGLAKSGTNAVTTHIVGTQGYIAPEYLADGLVTTKMDVFAYGVVLLELVTGREAVNERGEALWGEADKIFGDDKTMEMNLEGTIMAWMDPALVEQSCSIESVANVLSIARSCLRKDPTKRPSMVDVAYALSKADELLSDLSVDGISVASGDVVGR